MTTTVRGLLTDLRDVAMDLEAIGLQLERVAIPPVVDAGRLVTRKAGRLAALLEAAEKPLSEDDKHDLGLLMSSDALRVLRRLNDEAAPFDGVLPDYELGSADTQIAWGLVSCGLALQTVTDEYPDRDGDMCVGWGFAINSEGYAVLLLADRLAEAEKDARRLDALEAAMKSSGWSVVERIGSGNDGGGYLFGYPYLNGDDVDIRHRADTLRALADALEVGE